MEVTSHKHEGEFIATNDLLNRVKGFELNDDSYLFRSTVVESRKHCIEKCLPFHTSNILSHTEKICLKKCQDIFTHVSLSSFMSMQAALTLDAINKNQHEKVKKPVVFS